MALHDGSGLPSLARTGLRRQRGKLHSQLESIKDDLKQILAVAGNDDDPTVLDLEGRERKCEEELVQCEADLALIEEELQECLTQRSVQVSVKKAKEKSDKGYEEQQLAITPANLQALAVRNEPKGDTKAEVVPGLPQPEAVAVPDGGDDDGDSSSSPSSSSTSLSLVPTHVSSRGIVRDRRRLAYAPEPPIEYYSGRGRKRKTTLTSEAVGKIRFPKLTDRFRLKSHLGAFGRLLVEAGGGIHMSSHGEERFVPARELECSITIAFLATLEEKEVKEAAQQEVGDNCYEWQPLIDSLVKQFCSRRSLREEYHSRLRQLKFDGIRYCDVFIRRVKSIHTLYVAVFPEGNSELKAMIRLTVGKLPSNLRKQTVDKIRSCHQALSGGAWHLEDDCNQDWECLLPLVSLQGPSVVDAIRSACQSFEDSDQLGNDTSSSGKPTSGPSRVARIQEIESLEKACVSVYYGCGADSKNRDKVKALTHADFVFCGKNRKSKPFCIFGYRNDTPMPNSDELDGQLYVRPYHGRLSNSGNSGANTHQAAKSSSLTEQDRVAYAVSDGLIPPEIVLKAKFAPDISPDDWYYVDAVVDTGAGLSYWIGSSYPCLPCAKGDSSVVELADGSLVEIGQKVAGTLCLLDDSSRVPISFNILPSTTSSVRHDDCGPFRVLLGREALNRLGIVVSVPRDNFSQDGSPEICGVYSVDDVNADDGIVSLAPPPTMSGADSLFIQPTADESAIVSAALIRLCDHGWRPVPYAPKFEYSFRTLVPAEIVDIPQQSIVCELKFPQPTDSVVVHEYSSSLMARLSPARKRIFNDLVDEYVQRQWRNEVDRAFDSPFKANVFLLGGEGTPGSRKARLVCDFRLTNSQLPPASSYVPSTAAIFIRLLLSAPAVLLVGDITAAFYHIRLHQVKMLLFVGDRSFASDRLTFGVNVGPGGLHSSLSASQDELSGHLQSDIFELVVDDFMLAHDSVSTPVRDLSLWLNTLVASGQHTPYRKFSALSTPHLRDELQQALSDRGVTSSVGDTGKYLGVNIEFSDGYLVLLCERLDRLAQAAKKADEMLRSMSFSRRDMFALAGSLGTDPLLQHSVDRALADTLRSVAGAAGSNWDELVPITSTSYPVMFPLLKWVIERNSDASVCRHRSGSPLLGSGSVLVLECASDASLSGGGYVIDCVVGDGSHVTLREDCWRWRAKQTAWHSNRRELCALLRCLQSVGDIVTAASSLCSKHKSRFDIRIRCDNRATVSWSSATTSGLPTVPKSKSLERRAIGRLLGACADECAAIRRIVASSTISVTHLSGEENERADSLSRIFDRRCEMIDGSCDTLSSVLLAFDSNGIPPYDSPIESLMSYIVADDSAFLIASTDEEDSRIPSLQLDEMIFAESTLMVVDAVFSLRSLSVRSAPLASSLVEDIAGETWDLQGALETCGSLRKMLRAWFAHSCKCDVTGDSPTNELMTFVQSSQRSLPSEQRQRLVNGGGGISEEDGVIYFNLGSPIGEPLRQFYIPKSTPLWRKLLVRDAHRLCGHGGREATLAHCNQFYLPAGQREVRNLLFRCVPCRLEKARRGKSAPILQKDESKLMLEEPPYWRVDADVLHLGEKKKILVVVCRSTGHCSLFSLNKEDMTDILKCLHRAQLQRGGLRHVYVDNASYFCSALFHQEMPRTLGAEVHTLASSSPWEAGRANRLHGIALSILRKNLRFVRGRIPDGDDDFGLLLDYLAYVLNSRPLGQLIEVDSKMRPTTPDLLAFGYEKQVGPLQVAGFPLKCFPARDALAFRKHYLETYWRSLRTHVLETLGGSKQRRWRPYVGEPVAVIRQRMRKADIASCLGFVDSILSGNRVLVLLPGGRKQSSLFTIYALLKNP